MSSVMFSSLTGSLRGSPVSWPSVEGYLIAVLEGGGEAGGYGGRDRFIMINIIDLIIGEAGMVSWHRRFTSP